MTDPHIIECDVAIALKASAAGEDIIKLYAPELCLTYSAFKVLYFAECLLIQFCVENDSAITGNYEESLSKGPERILEHLTVFTAILLRGCDDRGLGDFPLVPLLP